MPAAIVENTEALEGGERGGGEVRLFLESPGDRGEMLIIEELMLGGGAAVEEEVGPTWGAGVLMNLGTGGVLTEDMRGVGTERGAAVVAVGGDNTLPPGADMADI